MRSIDRSKRIARRVDVRVGANLAVLFAPLVGVVLFGLHLFSANELLELTMGELDERLDQMASAWKEVDAERRETMWSVLTEQLARDGGGFSVRDQAGDVLVAGGSRSDAAATSQGWRWLQPVGIGAGEDLIASRRLAPGRTATIWISSDRFVQERDELLFGFWLSLAIGVGLVTIVALPATRRALAPLREATRVAESIEPARLGARLATRGTRDDVDRHALAVNQLLDQIESGLARITSFSHEVAHELRTPVHRIASATELWLLEHPEEDPSTATIEEIHRTADQIARLVEGLLLLARGEGDQLGPRMQEIDASELCETLREIYGPACEEAGIRFEVECRVGRVRADVALMLRALGNLLDNARRHVPAGGFIRLRATTDAVEPDFVAFEVEDSGAGIPIAEWTRVFDRFARTDDSDRSGLGLGLPISRAILRAHGGDVELREGSCPEAGARFVARWPRGAS